MNNRAEIIEAVAPGKIILFGEHAINRGEPAVAAAAGLYARCRIAAADAFVFRSGGLIQKCSRDEVRAVAERVSVSRRGGDFEQIRQIAASDYFAPQKYVLASAYGDGLPAGLGMEWQSEVPASSGLGSGGSAFTALVGAIAEIMPERPSLEQRAAWAYCGDVVAHGGVASALDTQTSLLGGFVFFTGQGLARQLAAAPGARFVMGHSGVAAATREVNRRVREWLESAPGSRMPYFRAVGALSRASPSMIAGGDWSEVGRLMNLNQLVLEKIGVSCAELERLIQAALEAGAYGAKISGSGGGGIMIALAPEERVAAVVEAIRTAGGAPWMPEVGVPGARAARVGTGAQENAPRCSDHETVSDH